MTQANGICCWKLTPSRALCGFPGKNTWCPAKGKREHSIFLHQQIPMVSFFNWSTEIKDISCPFGWDLYKRKGWDDSKTSAGRSTTWTYIVKTYDYDCHQQPYQNNLALTFISTWGNRKRCLMLQCCFCFCFSNKLQEIEKNAEDFHINYSPLCLHLTALLHSSNDFSLFSLYKLSMVINTIKNNISSTITIPKIGSNQTHCKDCNPLKAFLLPSHFFLYDFY